MADSSIVSGARVGVKDPVICVACGLDMTETPKIRRNLGPRHKGCSTEVCERVLRTWKELASATQWQILSIPEESLKMCRTCFNDYDKFAVRRAEVEKKLQEALVKLLNLSADSTEQSTSAEINSNTQLSTNRKRSSQVAHPAGIQRQVIRQEPPLVITSSATASPSATVS